MSNRNFSYIFSPSLLWGNVSSLSVTGLCNLVTKTLYYQINEWSSCYNIELPDINKSCISYGILPCNESNILQNVLILLFKKLVYPYTFRDFYCKCKKSRKIRVQNSCSKGKTFKTSNKMEIIIKYRLTCDYYY